MPPRPGRSLVFTLPATVAAEVARRAEACEIPVGRWVGEVIVSFLAGERCRHGTPAPEPSAAADPDNDAS